MTHRRSRAAAPVQLVPGSGGTVETRAMPEPQNLFQQLLDWLNLNNMPPPGQILASMDLVAWTLVGLLVGAVVLGVFLSVSTRRSFLRPDDLEATPEVTLARLKQDPTQLPPLSIVSRMGAEATLELLEFGDQVQSREWRYKWSPVREELLRLMAQQNAFGPTYALARYYRSEDTHEPDTIRIRRTALIHKLGLLRYLEPDVAGNPAQLRVRSHPADVQGDLGFNGETLWLLPEEPAPRPAGPIVEMEPVEFRTLQDATIHVHIRRSPSVGGGFRLHLLKRRKMWVVADEEIEWVG